MRKKRKREREKMAKPISIGHDPKVIAISLHVDICFPSLEDQRERENI